MVSSNIVQIMDSKLDKVREFATSEKAYRPPKAVNVKDASDVQDLDEIKLHELKEVRDLSIIATPNPFLNSITFDSVL